VKLFDEIDEDLRGEEEIDPVVACWERDVKRYYRKLSCAEETQVVDALVSARKELKARMLAMPGVRIYFMEKVDTLNARPGGSVAKLATDHNKKLKGNNSRITQRILAAMAADKLEDADFRIEEFEGLIGKGFVPQAMVQDLLDAIKVQESRLVQAGVKVATRLAIDLGSGVYGIDVKDLVQVANEKLLEAVKQFRPGAGTRFVTHAYWYISTQLKQHVMNNSREVRIPQGKVDLLLSILRAHNLMPEGHSITDLTKKVNEVKQKRYGDFTVAEVEKALSYLGSNPLPLDLSFGEDSEGRVRTLGEMLQSDNPSPEEYLEMKKILERGEDALLNSLTEIEAAVIYYRYLDPDYTSKRNDLDRPYADIPHAIQAARLDHPPLERETVRKIEKRALMKLRLDSEWFWNRLKDEVLSSFLNDRELMVFFVQTIRPALTNRRRKTWAEIERMTGIPARDAVRLARSARAKVRRNFPEIEQWVILNSKP